MTQAYAVRQSWRWKPEKAVIIKRPEMQLNYTEAASQVFFNLAICQIYRSDLFSPRPVSRRPLRREADLYRPYQAYYPTDRSRPYQVYCPTGRNRPHQTHCPTDRSRPYQAYCPTGRNRPYQLYYPADQSRKAGQNRMIRVCCCPKNSHHRHRHMTTEAYIRVPNSSESLQCLCQNIL